MVDEEKYIELEKKYNKLSKDHEKLRKRINILINISDRNYKSIFNKSLKMDKLNKRFHKIMKQSDRQSRHWLEEYEKQEQILIKQSKMASMGEMLENITHQMKQPLSLISTASTALELQKEMDMLTHDQFKSYTSKITDATEYLSDTIDSFKNFFSNNSKGEYFSLTNVIIKSKQLLENKFKGKNIKIIHELNDIKLFGMENDLIQVLTNLFSNSIDILDQSQNERLIFITSCEIDDKIVIEFGDSAGGIDDKIIGKVFQMHFTTKDKDKGSGVGLHMTKKIIEINFNGTIEVTNKNFTYNNKNYHGANFKITIPKEFK